MALVLSTLRDGIRKFTDEEYGSFVGFPVDDAEAALAWADTMDSFASLVAPPTTSAPAAKAGLVTGLTGISAPGAAIAIFDTAFAAYALTLAGGMGPANVGVPPPALLSVTPPTIATVFAAGAAGANAETQALAMATLIHAWMITGTFTPSGGGSPAPWS